MFLLLFSSSQSPVFTTSGNTFCLFSHLCCFFFLSIAFFHHLWQHFLPFLPFLLLFPPLNRLFSPPPATLFAFSLIYVAFFSSQTPFFTTSGNTFCLFSHFCCFFLLSTAFFHHLWQHFLPFRPFLLLFPSEPPNPTLSSHSMIQ